MARMCCSGCGASLICSARNGNPFKLSGMRRTSAEPSALEATPSQHTPNQNASFPTERKVFFPVDLRDPPSMIFNLGCTTCASKQPTLAQGGGCAVAVHVVAVWLWNGHRLEPRAAPSAQKASGSRGGGGPGGAPGWAPASGRDCASAHVCLTYAP